MGQALPRTRWTGESEIEIRQVFEAEDFGAALTPELREQEARLRRAETAEAIQQPADGGRRVSSSVTARPTARSTPSGASSRARLIAGLARMVRDVGLAEELAQDALVAALEQWPERASRTTRAPG